MSSNEIELTPEESAYARALREEFNEAWDEQAKLAERAVTGTADDVLRRYTKVLDAVNAIYGWPPYIGNDPGDEDTGRARDTGETDRDYVKNQAGEAEAQAETQARSDHLMDLAKRCDNDVMRDQAIDSLEGVVKSHEPPPPPEWVGNLSRFI